MIGHRLMGRSLLDSGNIVESRAHCDRAIAFYDPAKQRLLSTRFGQDSRVATLSFRSLAVWLLEPHTRLRYFCSPHHQHSALYPSITQLERAAGFRRDDTNEQRLDKLEAVLAQGTKDLSEAVPLLAELLSIPTGDRYPPLNLTPQKRKEKTLHAQVAQVEGLAARRPVLMVYEDMQWSDPTTRESLDLLIDRVPTLRVLAIITFRPEFAPPWVGHPHVTMLNLNRLSPRRRAEMIMQVTGGKALPREIADQIVDRTDGVPPFIEELTKSVIESGVLTDRGDRYTVTGPLPPLAIPTSLKLRFLRGLTGWHQRVKWPRWRQRSGVRSRTSSSVRSRQCLNRNSRTPSRNWCRRS
jgi:hypothetical protein